MDTVIIPLDRETALKLREFGYLLVAEIDFNTDTQKYDVALRTATTDDL